MPAALREAMSRYSGWYRAGTEPGDSYYSYFIFSQEWIFRFNPDAVTWSLSRFD
jgi:hypothetical protein